MSSFPRVPLLPAPRQSTYQFTGFFSFGARFSFLSHLRSSAAAAKTSLKSAMNLSSIRPNIMSAIEMAHSCTEDRVPGASSVSTVVKGSRKALMPWFFQFKAACMGRQIVCVTVNPRDSQCRNSFPPSPPPRASFVIDGKKLNYGACIQLCFSKQQVEDRFQT